MKIENRGGEADRPGIPSLELQELWFATRRRDWKSLAVVPAGPGASALPIAAALGKVGGLIRMGPVQVLNAEGMDLNRIATLVMEMTAAEPVGSVWTSGGPASHVAGREPAVHRLSGGVVIVVLQPVVENPLVLAVALAADAVLLCVRLGETDLAAARHTVELVGRERIVGTVIVRP